MMSGGDQHAVPDELKVGIQVYVTTAPTNQRTRRGIDVD